MRGGSLLVVVALASAMLLGCGNEENGQTTAGAASAGGQGEKAFIKEANSVCFDSKKQIQAELQPLVAKSKDASGEALGNVIEEIVVPGFEGELRDLEALEPPASYEDRFETVLMAMRKMIGEARENPAAFAAQDRPYGTAWIPAKENGLFVCGHP
jgi:hypothetical protein